MRIRRMLALLCLTVCMTACGKTADTPQRAGANYWDADGNPITFIEAIGQTTETSVAAESETDVIVDIETVQFHDQIIEKSKLSQDTIEWLEWYNSLTKEEQLAISFIPHDLYELLDYNDEEENVAAETNKINE